MAVATTKEYVSARETYQKEVRGMVMGGLKQVGEGKTKDFNSVCDKLEKKYQNVALQN